MARLFVYGSLKRGGRHHDELVGAVFLGSVTTTRGYRLEPLGEYLALVPAPVPAQPSGQSGQSTHSGPASGRESEAAEAVQGELFEIPDSLISALDDFEGDAYVRGEVRLEKGGLALAYFKKAG